MYVHATTHPLNTFVLTSASASADTDASSVADTDAPKGALEKDISQTLEKIVIVEADYSRHDLSVLPPQFEPQNGVWKVWMTEPANQGSCGSCWSFATVSALSDRFNILMRRKYINLLSPLLPTVCNDLLELLLEDDPLRIDTVRNTFAKTRIAFEKEACRGNSLITACYYLQFYGTTRSACVPYSLPTSIGAFKRGALNWGFPFSNSEYFRGQNTKLFDFAQFNEQETKGTCAFYNFFSVRPFAYCSDVIRVGGDKMYGSAFQHFQALFVYRIRNAVQDPRFLMYEIWRWGPIVTSFVVYEDFYEFDPVLPNAVYTHDPLRTQVVGGHAVEIVGWGVTDNDDKKPFWWVKNSWGPEYGLKGYFRFLRGSDHCGFETNAMAMMPNLFYPLDRVPSVAQLEKRVTDLGIFRVQITPEYNVMLNKVNSSLSPNPSPNLYLRPAPQTTKDYNKNFLSQAFTETQFPLLHFHVLSRMGHNVSEVLSPSGYNSITYRTMPGVYSGTPHVYFSLAGDFVAGAPTIPSPAPWSRPNTGLLSLLLVISMIMLIIGALAAVGRRTNGSTA